VSLIVDIAAGRGGFSLDAAFTAEGPVTALFGRSGAGKTTLADSVAGLTPLSRGHVILDDFCLSSLPAWKRRIGYVFQEPRLFPHLSVRKNLLYGHRASGPSLPEIADLLGLEALLERPTAGLSGGEARRVAIGRALLSDPRLLILDEPLAGLDGGRRAELLPFLDRLRGRGLPILYVSHAVDEVARLADEVVLLREGRILACAAPDVVFDHPEAEAAAGLTAPISILQGRVEAHDDAHSVTRLSIGTLSFLAPRLDLELGDRARVVIDARDVAIALSEPLDSSVQNRLPATVETLTQHASGGVLLILHTGGVRLKALITRTAVDQLNLVSGSPVFALVKATAHARHL
jgi:molybdate transport system ATP-binding protein